LNDSLTKSLTYGYTVDSCDYVARTLTYPGTGGRVVTHELNDRLTGLLSITDGSTNVASWTYDEANRRTSASLGNGVSTAFEYDINDRLKNIQHAKDTTKLFDIDYGYDEVGNRLFKRFNSVNGPNNMTSRSEVYTYDNRDRLTQMERGTISSIWLEGEMNWLNHPELAFQQRWTDLDRRGNWKEFKQWVGGAINNSGVTQTRDVNDVNQYTSIDPDGPATGSPTCNSGCTLAVSPSYNENGITTGNLTFDPTTWNTSSVSSYGLEYVYDEENRLTEVHRDTNGSLGTSSGGPQTEPLLMKIFYDAIGRRVETVEFWDAASNVALSTPRHTRYIFDGLQTIQEQVCDTSATCSGWQLAREFIWGDSSRFPEPVVLIDRTNAGAVSAGTDEPFYYLHDRLGSVIGLTNASGNLVERYTYDPYGKTYIEQYASSTWTANGGSGGAPVYSAYGNPFMWTGQRYDAPVSLVHFLHRSYSPTLGRWLQTDPKGYVDGVSLVEYGASSPIVFVDPFGLDIILGVHSNVEDEDESNPTAGHAWISVLDTTTGEYHTYGLWSYLSGSGKRTGVFGNDVSKDNENGRTGYDYVDSNGVRHDVSVTWVLSDKQAKELQQYIAGYQIWTVQNNCARWASKCVEKIIGIKVRTKDGKLLFFRTPRELAKWIRAEKLRREKEERERKENEKREKEKKDKKDREKEDGVCDGSSKGS
jgi:RHS repeat-associated protein